MGSQLCRIQNLRLTPSSASASNNDYNPVDFVRVNKMDETNSTSSSSSTTTTNNRNVQHLGLPYGQDIKLIYQNTEFICHSIILAGASKYLAVHVEIMQTKPTIINNITENENSVENRDSLESKLPTNCTPTDRLVYNYLGDVPLPSTLGCTEDELFSFLAAIYDPFLILQPSTPSLLQKIANLSFYFDCAALSAICEKRFIFNLMSELDAAHLDWCKQLEPNEKIETFVKEGWTQAVVDQLHKGRRIINELVVQSHSNTNEVSYLIPDAYSRIRSIETLMREEEIVRHYLEFADKYHYSELLSVLFSRIKQWRPTFEGTKLDQLLSGLTLPNQKKFRRMKSGDYSSEKAIKNLGNFLNNFLLSPLSTDNNSKTLIQLGGSYGRDMTLVLSNIDSKEETYFRCHSLILSSASSYIRSFIEQQRISNTSKDTSLLTTEDNGIIEPSDIVLRLPPEFHCTPLQMKQFLLVVYNQALLFEKDSPSLSLIDSIGYPSHYLRCENLSQICERGARVYFLKRSAILQSKHWWDHLVVRDKIECLPTILTSISIWHTCKCIDLRKAENTEIDEFPVVQSLTLETDNEKVELLLPTQSYQIRQLQEPQTRAPHVIAEGKLVLHYLQLADKCQYTELFKLCLSRIAACKFLRSELDKLCKILSPSTYGELILAMGQTDSK